MIRIKALINIRGAGGSGKTTAVKQYFKKNGCTVQNIRTPFDVLPITVLNGGKVIALGDYTSQSDCCGVDRFGKLKSNIMDCISEVDALYDPEVIIFEYKIGSHLYKSTEEIIQLGRAYNYEYFGVFLKLSEKERYERLVKRRKTNAEMKTFNGEQKACEMSCKRLEDSGHKIVTVYVENIKKEDMWKVVDFAIRKANG